MNFFQGWKFNLMAELSSAAIYRRQGSCFEKLSSIQGNSKSERQRLEQAIGRLRERAADKNADQTTKSIIEAFKLPDPQKDPELYRVYGSRFRPRLIVLWGCEKEAGSSIVPDAAPAKIKEESAGSKFTRFLPLLLILLLVLGLGYYSYTAGTFDNLLAGKDTPAESEDLVEGSGSEDPEKSDGSVTSNDGTESGSELSGASDADKGISVAGSDGNKDNKEETASGDTVGDSTANSDQEGAGQKNVAAAGPAGSDEGALIKPEGSDPATNEEGADNTVIGATGTEGAETEANMESQEPADPEQELVVEETDPESKEPDATRERPADGDLVNLAKITRSAVVLIAVGDTAGKVSGTGSGFLISPDGLVATNHHVLENAAQGVAKLANGKAFKVGEVIAANKQKDLAVFKIDTGSDELPFLALDEGAGAQVGMNIAVIGSPLGLEGTFTVGIVSSQRKINDVDHIQITAPISPGSSGSPVVDYDGTVVAVAVGGIEAGQALNFAIDVSELHDLLSEKGGSVGLLDGTNSSPLNKQDPKKLPSGAEWGGGGVIPETKSTAPPLTTENSPVDSSQPVDVVQTPIPQMPNGDGSVGSPDESSPAPSTETVLPGDSTTKENSYRIVQAEKKELSNGMVEVTLELQNSDGSSVDVKGITWKLDGAIPERAQTKGASFTHQIKQGDHTLSVEGETSSGNKISIHASMNIEVEVRSKVEILNLEGQ